jgi:hypothetical protein
MFRAKIHLQRGAGKVAKPSENVAGRRWLYANVTGGQIEAATIIRFKIRVWRTPIGFGRIAENLQGTRDFFGGFCEEI